MKQFWIDMFGKQAVEGFLAVWYWLWGAPVRTGGEMAVAAGESAIDNQVDVIGDLADAVGFQESAIVTISNTLNDTNNSIDRLEKQIKNLLPEGVAIEDLAEEVVEAATDLTIELEALEGTLPELKSQLEQATTNFENAKASLKAQERKLRQMQVQQQTNEAKQQITAALELATKKMKSVEIEGTSTLDKASKAINRRNTQAVGISNAHQSLGSTSRAAQQSSARASLARNYQGH